MTCGLGLFLFVLVKAEIENTAMDERGFYEYTFSGFRRRYISINELEQIWRKAFDNESYVLNKFLNELYDTYIEN